MFHVMLNKINKLFLLRALENGRYLSMNFAEYDQAFMDHQDSSDSAGKTAIRDFCSTDWLKKYHV